MIAVSVSGQQGEAFPRGTKQRRRLSPLLFGLLVKQLQALLQQQLPGSGPWVGIMRVSDILSADDVKLLPDCVEHVQRLLDVLHQFCTLFGMQVSVSNGNNMHCGVRHTSR